MGATLLPYLKKRAHEGEERATTTPIPIVSPTPAGTATPTATPSGTPTLTYADSLARDSFFRHCASNGARKEHLSRSVRRRCR